MLKKGLKPINLHYECNVLSLNYFSMLTHLLGITKVDKKRKLKFSIEKFLLSKKNRKDRILLIKKIRSIRKKNIKIQEKKLDITTIGMFPYYDKILTTMLYLGIIPSRYSSKSKIGIKKYFEIAKGNYKNKPLEMTKWFDTNYHFLVPEFENNLKFFYKNNFIKEEILDVKLIKNKSKFSIIGPITMIAICNNLFLNKKSIFKNIFKRYIYISKIIKRINIFQFEEPIINQELKINRDFYYAFYNKICKKYYKKVLFTSYFNNTSNVIKIIRKIKTYGVHVEYTKDEDLNNIKKIKTKIISLGIINGRNIWISNFKKIIKRIRKINKSKKILLSYNTSLEHIPYSVKLENISKKIKSWISFAKEKIEEILIIKKILIFGKKYFKKEYNKNKINIIKKKEYSKNSDILLSNKIKIIKNKKYKRKHFRNLIKFPTTTIGSFPQTDEIRKARKNFITTKNIQKYNKILKKNIKKIINFQKKIGIDVLVHGEVERKDMVEYFCESLGGCIITRFGWVHSYGTRCVKPPIIYSTVIFKKAITLKWIKYSMNITNKPIKGIITGPITILKWSFIRNDIKMVDIAYQISYALRKEVILLKRNGVKILQIDEPAYKECMPLQKKKKKKYVKWSTKVFKFVFSRINNLQIHTHICYSNLNSFDIKSFERMDIDVISIEAARSFMKIIKTIKNTKFSFEIGLGVYDIHSNYKTKRKEIFKFLKKIFQINKKNIWINPDCGLKTRKWKEIIEPLKNMVWAANRMKRKYKL